MDMWAMKNEASVTHMEETAVSHAMGHYFLDLFIFILHEPCNCSALFIFSCPFELHVNFLAGILFYATVLFVFMLGAFPLFYLALCRFGPRLCDHEHENPGKGLM